MNTPKYYIGQKVIFEGKEYSITDFLWEEEGDKYMYSFFGDGMRYAHSEEELTRPPAKLEFGYCAVGDVVEDDDDELVTIESVEKNMFACRWFDRIDWITYAQANKDGWKIKEEETSEWIEGVEETITLNGKTYKLVE